MQIILANLTIDGATSIFDVLVFLSAFQTGTGCRIKVVGRTLAFEIFVAGVDPIPTASCVDEKIKCLFVGAYINLNELLISAHFLYHHLSGDFVIRVAILVIVLGFVRKHKS